MMWNLAWSFVCVGVGTVVLACSYVFLTMKSITAEEADEEIVIAIVCFVIGSFFLALSASHLHRYIIFLKEGF